jgi:hypothetical protein
MAKKKLLLMEYVWLGIAFLTFGVFVYSTIKQGFGESYIMLIFSAVSVLMYLWRKKLRKSEE